MYRPKTPLYHQLWNDLVWWSLPTAWQLLFFKKTPNRQNLKRAQPLRTLMVKKKNASCFLKK
jgi:hypothetical protein